MSLSDKFCVERHRSHFIDLVKNKLDIVFANEDEMISLTQSQNFNEVVDYVKQTKKNFIITREKKELFL